MDLETTFFWLAMVSCVALLARSLPLARQGRGVGWTVVSAAILVAGGAGEIFFPTYAGRMVGALWGLFVVLPSLLIRAVLRHALGQRYARAGRIAGIVRWLHPADGWRETPALYRALMLAQAGQRERAAEGFGNLIELPGVPPHMAATARAYLYRMEGRWEEMLAWTDEASVPRNPSVALMRLRALGETGRPGDVLRAFEGSRAQPEISAHPSVWPTCQLNLFAFGGREVSVATLLEGPLAGLSPEAKIFWRATARMAAGQAEAARAELRELTARSDDRELRQAVERRLTHDLADARTALTAGEQAALDGIEAQVQRDRAYQPPVAADLRRAFVTLALVALNLGAFVVETARGGSENIDTLLRLGALWPDAVFAGGQWYRLAAALFLHFGPVHLALNLLGLAAIGPWVEKTLGRVRYTLVYFVAGVGSMAAVLGLIRWSWMRDEMLVGASGAIMGLVGATAALLAVGWRREGSGLAARRLRVIALIVVFQVVFDLLTPQVSFAAHAAGLVLGFLLTALLAAPGTAKARGAARSA